MASGRHLSYRFVHWRDVPVPFAGKWPPEATFRIDLYPGGMSLCQLLVNDLRRPLFVKICTLAGPPWASCLEMASRGHFSYRFVCWRDLPGPAAGKWPPEATFRIDLYAGATSLGTLVYYRSEWLLRFRIRPTRKFAYKIFIPSFVSSTALLRRLIDVC